MKNIADLIDIEDAMSFHWNLEKGFSLEMGTLVAEHLEKYDLAVSKINLVMMFAVEKMALRDGDDAHLPKELMMMRILLNAQESAFSLLELPFLAGRDRELLLQIADESFMWMDDYYSSNVVDAESEKTVDDYLDVRKHTIVDLKGEPGRYYAEKIFAFFCAQIDEADMDRDDLYDQLRDQIFFYFLGIASSYIKSDHNKLDPIQADLELMGTLSYLLGRVFDPLGATRLMMNFQKHKMEEDYQDFVFDNPVYSMGVDDFKLIKKDYPKDTYQEFDIDNAAVKSLVEFLEEKSKMRQSA